MNRESEERGFGGAVVIVRLHGLLRGGEDVTMFNGDDLICIARVNGACNVLQD